MTPLGDKRNDRASRCKRGLLRVRTREGLKAAASALVAECKPRGCAVRLPVGVSGYHLATSGLLNPPARRPSFAPRCHAADPGRRPGLTLLPPARHRPACRRPAIDSQPKPDAGAYPRMVAPKLFLDGREADFCLF
jgi:hypothetical protein